MEANLKFLTYVLQSLLSLWIWYILRCGWQQYCHHLINVSRITAYHWYQLELCIVISTNSWQLTHGMDIMVEIVIYLIWFQNLTTWIVSQWLYTLLSFTMIIFMTMSNPLRLRWLFALSSWSNMCNFPKKLLLETKTKKRIRCETCWHEEVIITNQYVFEFLDW